MTFYTINHFPLSPSDLVCRTSRVSGVIITLIFAAISIGLWFTPLPDLVKAVVSVLLALFTLLLIKMTIRSFGVQNWLLRYGQRGLSVKFRTFLNAHFPQSDPVIVSFDYKEIAWVRRTRERRIDRDSESTTYSRFTYLDLGLKNVALAELERMLADERRRKAPGRFVRTRHNHAPVRLIEDNVLRLDWSSIKPSIHKTLEVLTRFAPRKPDHEFTNDMTIDPVSRAEAEARILELAQSGDKFTAVKLARKHYGYSLTEARNFVDGLVNGAGPARRG